MVDCGGSRVWGLLSVGFWSMGLLSVGLQSEKVAEGGFCRKWGLQCVGLMVFEGCGV